MMMVSMVTVVVMPAVWTVSTTMIARHGRMWTVSDHWQRSGSLAATVPARHQSVPVVMIPRHHCLVVTYAMPDYLAHRSRRCYHHPWHYHCSYYCWISSCSIDTRPPRWAAPPVGHQSQRLRSSTMGMWRYYRHWYHCYHHQLWYDMICIDTTQVSTDTDVVAWLILEATYDMLLDTCRWHTRWRDLASRSC